MLAKIYVPNGLSPNGGVVPPPRQQKASLFLLKHFFSHFLRDICINSYQSSVATGIFSMCNRKYQNPWPKKGVLPPPHSDSSNNMKLKEMNPVCNHFFWPKPTYFRVYVSFISNPGQSSKMVQFHKT